VAGGGRREEGGGDGRGTYPEKNLSRVKMKGALQGRDMVKNPVHSLQFRGTSQPTRDTVIQGPLSKTTS
jgi:hypothetical protein